MLMMVTSSVYGAVDGIMVSNFAGTTAFAAINLIWPFVAILGAFGFMIGIGGSALVAKIMGEGDMPRARSLFSMFTYVTISLSVVMGVFGLLMVRRVAIMLGAEGEMINLCVTYGGILFIMLPAYMMQVFFQSMLITAEKPKMGMWVMIGAGLVNVALDWVFIAEFGWGVAGAAWATGLSQFVGGIVPLVYLAARRPGVKLWLGRCRFDVRALMQASSNGVSEFVMNISLSIVSMLYMMQLMAAAGERGVSAYGVMMYFAFAFCAFFIGYGIGVAPVVSFHYGADDNAEIKSLLHKSLWITGVGGIAAALVAQLFAVPLSMIFVSYDSELCDLTVHAFRVYSLMFVVTGVNIFSSAFFTALNNGPVSALISLLRTLVFEAGCVLMLPMIWEIEGIWWSVVVAEGITFVVALWLIYAHRRRYGYN